VFWEGIHKNKNDLECAMRDSDYQQFIAVFKKLRCMDIDHQLMRLSVVN
jgi:hypothetical protein